MEWLQNEPVVIKITAAVFVPAGSGAPVHKNRSAHGLAFNVNHTTTYRFAGGKILTCGPAECVYLPQGTCYTVDKTEKSSDPNAGVHAINFLLAEPMETVPRVLPIRGTDALLSAFSRAEKAWRQKATGFREECFADLYSIIRNLKREQAGYFHRDRVLTLLAPALEYIDQNYTKEPIDLPQLAKLCGVSQPYLRRLFHTAFCVPPAVYVRNKRLRYAKELLQTGEYSVTEAAVQAGFNDTAYFSREFKKVTGTTPRLYIRTKAEK